MPKYDLAFPLGPACSCSQTLRKAGRQYLSFPFDWAGPFEDTVAYEEDLPRRIQFICNGFAGWFDDVGDFSLRDHPLPNGMHNAYNDRLELRFPHDFPADVPLERSYPSVAQKYRHRIRRFLNLVDDAHTLVILRVERPDLVYRTPLSHFREARAMLQARFPGKEFDFVSIQPDASVSFAHRRIEKPEPWLTVVSFDIQDHAPGAAVFQSDLALTAAAIASLFSVRDYRSAEEIRAHEAAQLRKRLQAAGCETVFQFRARKIRHSILKRVPALRYGLPAGLFRKRFAYILPFGVNCEVAFRFYLRWGFVDSSLFAWTQSFELETLTRALENFDKILDGEATFDVGSFMWKCENTGLCFHGKIKHRPGAIMPPPDVRAADLADLRGRIAHLKRKFLAALQNEESVLLVHRLAPQDAKSDQLDDRLHALERALDGLQARNWTLLVISEKRDAARMPKGDRRVFRSVLAFNPSSRITDRKLGDEWGWRSIFSEFAPLRILPKKHAFNFE